MAASLLGGAATFSPLQAELSRRGLLAQGQAKGFRLPIKRKKLSRRTRPRPSKHYRRAVPGKRSSTFAQRFAASSRMTKSPCDVSAPCENNTEKREKSAPIT